MKMIKLFAIAALMTGLLASCGAKKEETKSEDKTEAEGTEEGTEEGTDTEEPVVEEEVEVVEDAPVETTEETK